MHCPPRRREQPIDCWQPQHAATRANRDTRSNVHSVIVIFIPPLVTSADEVAGDQRCDRRGRGRWSARVRQRRARRSDSVFAFPGRPPPALSRVSASGEWRHTRHGADARRPVARLRAP